MLQKNIIEHIKGTFTGESIHSEIRSTHLTIFHTKDHVLGLKVHLVAFDSEVKLLASLKFPKFLQNL